MVICLTDCDQTYISYGLWSVQSIDYRLLYMWIMTMCFINYGLTYIWFIINKFH